MAYWDNEDWDEDEPRIKRPSIMRAPNHSIDNPMWNGKPIKKMESDHIMNAILYCEKRFVEAFNNWFQCHHYDGNIAIKEVRQDFYFRNVYDMFPDYRYLRTEWERRKDL